MNPRILALKYMGWCPGVDAAVKFIPDREIPLERIFLLVPIMVASISFTYLISYAVFAYLGYSFSETVTINYFSSKLMATIDETYLAAGVLTPWE